MYTDLIAFEKHQEKERLRAQLARKSQSSLFDQDEPSDSDEEEIKQGDKAGSGDKGGDSEKERGSKAGAKILDGADGSANADKDVDLMTDVSSSHDERIELIPKSAMEEAEEKMRKRLLQHERKKLKEKIEFAINTFDRAIAKLRREKLKLDADLKTTDLKMLTLYEELHLLREFEDTENRLVAKFKKAKAAKAQVVADMTDCEKQLAAKLSEIKAWKEKDIQVMNEFNLVVGGEKNPFYATLLKIFKKNVKRNKSKKARDADLNDEDDSDADNDQYDSDDDGSDDESDTDEENDDACPDKCENSIYEKVLELREKRLEQEEIYMEFKKAVGELNKTYYDRHQGREKSIDKELINTNREIEAFQQEKQRALNLIEVTVPLKLAQMKYLVGGKLPANISDSLIFTSTGMQTLRERIEELVEEKNNLTLQFKALKRGHKILIKELQQKRDLIAVEKKKCEDVQMLKFGQIIDLSILAKVGVDEGAAELRRKLKVLEGTSVRKLTEWDRRIMEAKNELATITQQNTSWLERVAQLTKAQYDLEDQLNSTTKNVHVADTSPVDEKDSNERRQLLQLVQIQEKEIDALKAEIHVLRRKGGHVYTPQ